MPQKQREKLDKFKSSYNTKQAAYAKEKVELSKSYEENSERLAEVKGKVDEWADSLSDNFIPIYLKVSKVKLKWIWKIVVRGSDQ